MPSWASQRAWEYAGEKIDHQAPVPGIEMLHQNQRKLCAAGIFSSNALQASKPPAEEPIAMTACGSIASGLDAFWFGSGSATRGASPGNPEYPWPLRPPYRSALSRAELY